MSSGSGSADEANGSFGPARRSSRNVKPGFGSVERDREAPAKGERRIPSSDAPRTALAERIRGEEGAE
jgi:hypothetical protein